MSGLVHQVIWRWVVLSAVICKDDGSSVPVETKLALGFAAMEPVQADPNHFDLTLDNGIIHETCCRRVICLDGSFGLGPIHFLECIS